MNLDPSTIDRIVAGVLTQLADGGERVPGGLTTQTQRHGAEEDVDATAITATVITADVLLESLSGQTQITVAQKAIVTPAAWDAARERGLKIVRRGSGFAARSKNAPKPDSSTTSASNLLVVVRHTESLDRLWEDISGQWQRELLGCPDEAAEFVTSALCRGAVTRAVVLAEQTHRAACRANRNERVNAVAIGDAGDIRTIRKQLQANVWCIDPTARSWFELRNLFRAISAN